MLDLAPGNILQRMHLRRRLQVLHRELGRPARFIEFGIGTGWLSEIALAEGCTGLGYDPNPKCCVASGRRNEQAVRDGRYRIRNEEFTHRSTAVEPRVDLVFSCMVLEHLSGDQIHEIVEAARRASTPGGLFAAFVPAGTRYWGIEDEIAGHLRRYERHDFFDLARRESLEPRYWTGLTFPLSNLLRGLSDCLVARSESRQLERSLDERTFRSGHREVLYKTRFPPWARPVLNEWALAPFDLLQRLFGHSPRSMVAYYEWFLNPPDP